MFFLRFYPLENIPVVVSRGLVKVRGMRFDAFPVPLCSRPLIIAPHGGFKNNPEFRFDMSRASPKIPIRRAKR